MWWWLMDICSTSSKIEKEDSTTVVIIHLSTDFIYLQQSLLPVCSVSGFVHDVLHFLGCSSIVIGAIDCYNVVCCFLELNCV